MNMFFFYLSLIIILALFIAKMEGNVEGPYPWAKKLPTKRYKNRVTNLLFDGKEITGYHIWLFSTLFLFFHYHFLLGYPWSLKNELMVLAAFIFFATIEDFLAIILNPYFGLQKFSRKYVVWHKHWVSYIPLSYIQGLILSALLFFISFSL